MKDTFIGRWGTINKLKLDEVVDLIVTGRTASEAKPDEWMYSLLGDEEKPITVLDFGCGVGRNSFGFALSHMDWTVIGYDSEQMISRVPEYAAIHYDGVIPNNLWFVSDWNQLTRHKFEKIICCLVLQHIEEPALVNYCKDFKTMTKVLFVAGRRYNDDIKHRSTWTILEEQGLVPDRFMAGCVTVPYSPDGDPVEHNSAFYFPNV